jgi:hypothetical protein
MTVRRRARVDGYYEKSNSVVESRAWELLALRAGTRCNLSMKNLQWLLLSSAMPVA